MPVPPTLSFSPAAGQRAEAPAGSARTEVRGDPAAIPIEANRLNGRIHGVLCASLWSGSLPRVAEVELLPLDPVDWLDEPRRAALHRALRESDVDVAHSRLVAAEEILREIRPR